MLNWLERYRQELRTKSYCALSIQEAAEIKAFYHSSEFSELLGEQPSAEIYALLDMLLSERVPPDTMNEYILRYVRKEAVLRNTLPFGRKLQ